MLFGEDHLSTYLLDFFVVPFFALLFFVADFFAPPFALLLEAVFLVPPFDDAFLVAIGCSCSFFWLGLNHKILCQKLPCGQG